MGAGVGPLFREQELMASKFGLELVSICRELMSKVSGGAGVYVQGAGVYM